jgi:adenosine 3'-phospho 5'-phosphosulfate transporter B3
LQALSTVADAFLPNLQQKLFKLGASTLEVTYYSNLYVFAIMTLTGGGSGQLQGALAFVRADASHGALLLAYSLVAYFAISTHIRIVKSYGAVVGVLRFSEVLFVPVRKYFCTSKQVFLYQ